jgi:hypothetical protein
MINTNFVFLEKVKQGVSERLRDNYYVFKLFNVKNILIRNLGLRDVTTRDIWDSDSPTPIPYRATRVIFIYVGVTQ